MILVFIFTFYKQQKKRWVGVIIQEWVDGCISYRLKMAHSSAFIPCKHSIIRYPINTVSQFIAFSLPLFISVFLSLYLARDPAGILPEMGNAALDGLVSCIIVDRPRFICTSRCYEKLSPSLSVIRGETFLLQRIEHSKKKSTASQEHTQIWNSRSFFVKVGIFLE